MLKLVINSIATSPGGGLTNLMGLLEGWRDSKSEFKITIITSHPEAISALSEFSDQHSIVEVPPMSMVPRMRWERFNLPSLLEDIDADVLLSNNYASPGVPCPQVVHHQNLFLWSDWLPKRTFRLLVQRWMVRRTIQEASAHVFISEFLMTRAHEMVPALADKSSVIHYGLDHGVFDQQMVTGEVQFPTHRLCAIQSPSIFKDNDSLLRAFFELVTTQPDTPWRLEIAGYGEWDRWERLASVLGVEDRISWLGHVGSREIAEMLGRSDCLIYPSVMEAFGIPILEGMAAGCPVIAVESGPAHEISQGAYLSIRPKDPGDIVRAVQAIYGDEELRNRLIKRGLERAGDFSWTTAANRFSNVLESTVATHR